MFEGRDPSSEIVCEANRAFVVESGPVKPILDFSTSEISGRKFKFQKKWYEEYTWLEYSVSKDAAFCFSCRCFGALGKNVQYFYSPCTVRSCLSLFGGGGGGMLSP
jgi:hypothetical protein